ncbi:Dabb family protein [Paenibacillus sp. P96]|uniref:Dabb family protein n=1 Tax=Paenibacillus zeirhizosphaerae TaxID=2987519 RepID=A0ABT9FRH7_9BACL|nr:Dabb family protein [Paenibacillus sp. P96]MDP4097121.1 Dabb family protein [Paenibacillus sp. P96]
MYEHIVLIKFKDSFTLDKQEEAVKQAHSFKDAIAGIVGLSAGINVTEETENRHGYSLAIRITFEDQQACRSYIEHPLHQQFLQGIGPFVDGVVVADYPFNAV